MDGRLILFFFCLINLLASLLVVCAALWTPIVKMDKYYPSKSFCSITVIIPARNESTILKKCLDSLIHQININLLVHVAINNSNKTEIDEMQQILLKYPSNFSSYNYGEMSDEWVSGKSWVLHNVLQKLNITSNYILFLDADVQLRSNKTLASVISYFKKAKKYDMISLYPKFITKSFVERLVLSMVPSVLSILGFLGHTIFRGKNSNFSNLFGIFILFPKKKLEQLNKELGHEGLKSIQKSHYSDDIALGRLFIENKRKVLTLFGGTLIQSHMFPSTQAAIKGMQRFGSNSFGSMSKFYQMMGILFILIQCIPDFGLIGILLYYCFSSIFYWKVFGICLLLLGLSMISEYLILLKCDMKGITSFLITPIKFIFYFFGMLSILSKNPLSFMKSFNYGERL